jgi:hypothetical protein
LNSSANPWQSLDLILRCESPVDAVQTIHDRNDTCVLCTNSSGQVRSATFSRKILEFLWQCIRATVASGPGVDRVVRLIVPLQAGHIVRSNIVALRMLDSEHIETAMSLADPLQTSAGRAVTSEDTDDLETLFSAAAAGLIFKTSNTEIESVSLAVDLELESRLSFPWILSEPAQAKTLVLVDANSAHPAKGGTGSALYLAAQALGIKLVVFDNGIHWLEEPEYAHWREAFIPTRLTNPPEKDLTDTILKSIKEYGKPIDGIITFADSY